MTPVTRIAVAGWLSWLVLLGGCLAAKQPGPSELQTGEKKIVGPAEYEYVYVTGSLIPIKVPKSSTARPLPNANPVSTMDGDAFDRLIRRGQVPNISQRGP